MKIVSKQEANEVVSLLKDIMGKAKRQYELRIFSGANVHTYKNLFQTAWLSVSKLEQCIKLDSDIKTLQNYTDLAVHNTYQLAKWIGERIDK